MSKSFNLNFQQKFQQYTCTHAVRHMMLPCLIIACVASYRNFFRDSFNFTKKKTFSKAISRWEWVTEKNIFMKLITTGEDMPYT